MWHGSATTLASAALAGKWGDPLFSANAIQPRQNYKVLIDHYRSEYIRHGHDARYAFVGSGSGGTYIADTTQQAKEQYGRVYEGLVASFNTPGNNTPFRDIDHAVAEGPALVGSPQQVIDKILSYHESFGHDLQSISLPTTLPFEERSAFWIGSRPKSSRWCAERLRRPSGPIRTPTAAAPHSPAARSPTPRG